MRIIVATTTIHVPHALKAFRAADADVFFCIMGDCKSPDAEIVRALDGLGNFLYMSIDQQHERSYACDKLLGENTIGRRSIALLEALRMKADVIIYWDDDNLMMSTDYFDRFATVLGAPFSGLGVTGDGYWFDVGRYLIPKAPHRGFPVGWSPAISFDPVVDRKVGVAAGICMGDPDISAVDRISQAPIVHQASEVLRAGIVVEPTVRTVFNSQNTAFLRELAPCFLMCPQFGRHDDIFASLIAQRVMRERNLHVHFGQPFVWQQRNPHDLVKDLKAELWGMGHVVEFAGLLDAFVLPGKEVVEDVRHIWSALDNWSDLPPGVSELGQAWCEDVEKVL